MKFLIKLFLAALVIVMISCSTDEAQPKNDEIDDDPVSGIESRTPVAGVRIAWDFNTKTLVSQENDTGYSGYPRLIQLEDESLLVVYESKGNVLVKKSNDSGENWSEPITVVKGDQGVNMATPDVLQLQNGAILVMYNPRPGETADPTKKFLIKTILSNDNGMSWQNDQVVYEGDTEFENGVWEPTALQLPEGEIQLFFSNESIYPNSNEQNISLLRSKDHGLTWSEPEIVSFRAGSRDGMPAPLYLDNQNEIMLSIEDNGEHNQFKPYIIRNSVSENWSHTIGGSSEQRNYALLEELENSEYAGAPYLAQLQTGETLLSYQGTDARNGNDLNNADMKVALGNENGEDFNRISTPFLIPEGKSALWNSIAVLNDNTVIALTTTNAFSSANASEVWMIKGQVIPELKAEHTSLEIDGETTEGIWKDHFPIFIGHTSSTRLQANVSFDNQNLYIISKVSDVTVSTDNQNIANNDGMVIYLDPSNKSFETPGPGTYKIIISASNQVLAYEGNDSQWREIELTEMDTEVINNEEGYAQEIALAWNAIGGKPTSNTIGLNVELIERGDSNYIETISATQTDAPYTWLSLKL
ncbi:hypothetical protein APR41_16840 [Salegentibacter salinarum]|uniref:Carbohydrate-binding domain-containing protein n=1 Tax=Salegentibacter salinarum TaxID=447422 RepID=A0A2N0TWP6_9FLAO|nr:sugar-binding protein [Salegentibacter salinarum]PKD19078.1 hypothetical protein APR41_16840 [Salegentibacter salinarum]SKB95756.1 BNR repeat-like domain-containing protein [Salegentibacter salinarum]